MKIEVLIEIQAKTLDKTFTYNVPDNLIPNIKIGKRVTVPFGRQIIEGFILKISDTFETNYQTKDIIAVIDEEVIINKEMLYIATYIAKKYLTTKISALQTMLPSALKAKINNKTNKKYITFIKLTNKDYKPRNEKQAEIIELLKQNDQKISDLKEINTSINTLLKNNIVEKYEIEEYRLNIKTENISQNELNQEQENAYQKIKENLNNYKPILLHGVTGSGKTEVYIKIIKEIIKQNKQAIVLVPEISLTPQIITKFKNSFDKNIAVLHSGLSNGEKYDEWRKIKRQEVDIVIGARSAIFAPLNKLGIIIIDEEHTSTYKQDSNPKYHAIDIACLRAKTHNVPVVLASATPSIESYTNAINGNYELLTLKEKYNKQKNKITMIDMSKEIKQGNTILSNLLKQKIEEKLEKNEQIIILLNRRGYSTILTCNSCGDTEKCPACDIPYTYHKTSNNLRCHYCGLAKKRPIVCNNCQSEQLSTYGLGTQQLEEYLEKTFNKKIIRMDKDTTSKKGSHEKIINDFKEHKYDILIGTQMISKGLNFENVTLVGVLQGDAPLNNPDFRASERTFQLLNQVTGRSGRGEKPGEVIIQGFNLEHYSMTSAAKDDYQTFYRKEIEIRKQLNYPPFYNICNIKIKSKKYEEASKESNKVYTYLKNNLKNNIILGPSVAPIPKMNNIYTFQIMIKYKKINEVITVLNKLKSIYVTEKVNLDFDLNPQ